MKLSTPKTIIAFLLCLFVAGQAVAQKQLSADETRAYQKVAESRWKESQKRVQEYAKAKNIPIRVEYKSGTVIELVDIQNGLPEYITTYNDGAAITTRANELSEGGKLGLSLNGSTYNKKVGVWDSGKALKSHQEFSNDGGTTSRVQYGDSGNTTSFHATHVTGTIAASGVDPRAKGMAPFIQVKSFDWSNPISEMVGQAGVLGMEISNHSWGSAYGWHYNEDTYQYEWTGEPNAVEDYRFGYYGSTAREWDEMLYDYPNFLVVNAAGNDRGEGPYNSIHEVDGGADGYDCLSGFSLSKNVLTVGAVREVLNYTNPNSVIMSSFSDWGPTDDGRIKPEIVAKGVQVYSCTNYGNTAYDTYDGTSMASPNATGTIALLLELYKQYNNNAVLLSSTVKALVVNTADECGPNVGPDYMYGFGLLNAEAAAELIMEDQYQNCIDEIVYDGTEYTRQINITGNRPLRITACWTDYQGVVHAAALNNRASSLTNDIDLSITGPNGVTYYPYQLNPDNPSAAATNNSKNSIDNLEQVYIAAPTAGTYTIHISHEGTIVNNTQNVSIVCSGIDDYTGVPECVTDLVSPTQGQQDVMLTTTIKWNPAMLATQYKVYFGTDGAGTQLPTNIKNGEMMEGTSFDFDMKYHTNYYIAIQPANQNGVNEDCTTIFTFKTMDRIEVGLQSYEENCENLSIPSLPQYWITKNYTTSADDFMSNSMASYTGSQSIVLKSNNGMYDENNWLLTPIFKVFEGHKYFVELALRSYMPIDENVEVMWGYYPKTDSLTQTLYSNSALTSEWTPITADFSPSRSGIAVIGIHAKTSGGFGIFVDDFKIYDEHVGIEEAPQTTTKAYFYNGNLTISLAQQAQTNITVYNALGQQVLSTQTNEQQILLPLEVATGIYLVNVVNENINETVKVIVK